jgi:hypothetical protein
MNKDKSSYIDYKNTPQKCLCVPSGRCHSDTLLGCPHPHYYNEKNVWICVIDPNSTLGMAPFGFREARTTRPTLSPSFLSTASSSQKRPTLSPTFLSNFYSHNK